MVERLAPLINDLSKPFWNGASEGRLCLPWCCATSRSFWPPSPSSPFRDGGAVRWRDVDPLGVVQAIVTYRRAFQQALADRLPYAVALVEVAPGVRLLAHLAGPSSVSTGDRVRLEFQPLRAGELPVLSIVGSA